MEKEIANSIAKFLYNHNFENTNFDIYTIYNLWLSSQHFVVHDITKVLWILNFIKRVQAMDKAFLLEALLLE